MGLLKWGALLAVVAAVVGAHMMFEPSLGFVTMVTGIAFAKPLKPRPAIDLSGKTVVVTGCSAGIGVEALRYFVENDADVVMAIRNKKKGEKVRSRILKETGKSGANVEIRELDLASFASVRKFAKDWNATGRAIDILMNNAGMINEVQKTTGDGIEMVYQVNHLSPFLLTNLLLPAIKKAGGARIVTVSSSMHYLGMLDEEAYSVENKNLGKKGRMEMFAYSDTKLFNVMFSNELNKRLEGTGVISLAIHPGYVISDLDSNMGDREEQMRQMRDMFARPTAEGAATQIMAAVAPELSSAGGIYLEDRCIDNLCSECFYCDSNSKYGVTTHYAAQDPVKRTWLWETSAALTGL